MNYEFFKSEKKLMEYWEKEKIYKFDSNSRKKFYSIDTPPPTLSGRMHIGHAFSYSQQDFIARYRRMNGYNVFYPFGTDDNGLPTERLVEKTEGVKAKDMTRQEFVNFCLKFLKTERPKFIQDWKDIGISCDWDILYSTIDEHSRRIAQWSFLDLYKKNRVYRKDAPAMWCPECRTGVAQVEIKDKEIDSNFNDIIFKIEKESLVISTTRPELLPACVSVFYNPEDSRYKKYKGKMAKVPLFNFEVPIMEDKRADPKKGSGIVMCCTFGDQTDMEWQKAYELPIKTAISENGHMTSITGKYSGLKIKEARKEILKDLRDAGLLLKQTQIKHAVNVHERCGTEIEFIKSKQWFVKYLDLKEEMLKWGRELNWHPEFMKYRYDNWVNGLQWDWLISNQRYFGVAFPVWYCSKCSNVIIAKEEQLPVDPQKDKPLVKECNKCKSKSFVPEEDVLNTWFTSSMTPQIAVQLVKDKKIQEKLFPMSLRPQAHEIISFWLFNTVIKSRLHYGKNPWKDAAISGFVTLQGEKMSKSKGNVIEPQTILNKYGADALRFWAASSKLGEDFDYKEKELVAGQRTITKLINATKFVFMNLNDYQNKISEKLETVDSWFAGKMNRLIKECTESFDNYEYSKAKSCTEIFFWHEFCDNYLEIVKDRLYNPDRRGKEARKSAQHNLYNSLFNIIKLFAPIMPFITEEIYLEYYKKRFKEKSIHLTDWPKATKNSDTGEWDYLVEVLNSVRKEKARLGKSMKEPVKLLVCDKKLKDVEDDLKAVTKAEKIEYGKEIKVVI